MRRRAALLLVVLATLGMLALTPVPASAAACTISGTSGDDNLPGTPGSDKICGFNGHDTVFGFAGDDIVTAGYGDDRVNGGNDDDVLKGGPNDDNLQADDLVGGNDSAIGNAGTDTCSVDPGDTTKSCETIFVVSSIQMVAEDVGAGDSDWWSFTGAQGDEYGILALRTTSWDPVAKICKDMVEASCFKTGDDEFDCPVAGPFDCPEIQGALPSDGDGTYYILVRAFAFGPGGSYTLDLGEYIGTGFGALTLAADDV